MLRTCWCFSLCNTSNDWCVRSFHKDYDGSLKDKKEEDVKLFVSVEKSISGFLEALMKFYVPSTTWVSQEQLSSMLSFLESCFKTNLSPFLDLVMWLPTNSPRSMNVSQGGERGVVASKDSREDKGKVFWKVISTQIPMFLPMKPIITTSSTTTPMPNVKVDLFKLQHKKVIWIWEGGSISWAVKPITNTFPKDKGKRVHVEPLAKEKKRLQEIELERMRQLSNIMRQRIDDPLGLNKGDPNKVWNNEMIETRASLTHIVILL